MIERFYVFFIIKYKNRGLYKPLFNSAPAIGFEPTTERLHLILIVSIKRGLYLCHIRLGSLRYLVSTALSRSKEFPGISMSLPDLAFTVIRKVHPDVSTKSCIYCYSHLLYH